MTRDKLDPNKSGDDDAVSLTRDTRAVAYPLTRQGLASRGKRLGLPGATGLEYTIRRAGCMLASLNMLYAFLKERDCMTMDAINDLMVSHGCFDGPLLFFERGAGVLGLKAPAGERYRGTLKTTLEVAEIARQVFLDGKIACFHVDHDGKSQTGDIYGDHFIAAFAKIGDRYLCGDPATGKLVDIAIEGMSGTSLWQTDDGVIEKQYTVVGVIPVSL